MARSLKKDKSEIRTITDIDMRLMIEKDIRARICHGIHRYVKANNKYMEGHEKNKEPSYLNYCEINNLYGWAISKNLPLCIFRKKNLNLTKIL